MFEMDRHRSFKTVVKDFEQAGQTHPRLDPCKQGKLRGPEHRPPRPNSASADTNKEGNFKTLDILFFYC